MWAASLAIIALGAAAWGSAQEFAGKERAEGSFHFVRLRFNLPDNWAGRRFGPWSHDYPKAEQNLLKVLSEQTSIETSERSHLILDMEDPEVMKYPVLYVSEPGYWSCTEAEVTNLRQYLLGGGFIIFDDFRDNPDEWQAFSGCMQEVMPEYTYRALDVSHPIFHCFYDIETLSMTQPYSVPGPPIFYGLTDDKGRLMSIANFNNDLGDYWEWSDQSIVPPALSKEAYKFGVNYILYALDDCSQ